MLNIGDTAPDFSLTDDAGESVTLDTLLDDQSLILYFYPADFTPICTQEACAIRDMHEDIVDVGVNVVGISPQSESTHQRFKQQFKLPFPLLYDKSKKVIKAYGVDGLFVAERTALRAKGRSGTQRLAADLR